MRIETLYGIEGAKKATGLTVVIDVFRAFSTACYVFYGGAERIIPVEDLEVAYWLKKENPDFILMGERSGVIQPGFDFGNSPSEILEFDFRGKTVVQTTTAGTRGLVNSTGAKEILTGSFVNAGAIVAYLQSKNPKTVSLVCTGTKDENELDEDAICALYLKNALLGKSNNFEGLVEYLRTADSTRHSFDPAIEPHSEADFQLCLALDKFPFVIKAEQYEDNHIYLKKIDQPF
jgi:2-phosphosulfolactate phosphatase